MNFLKFYKHSLKTCQTVCKRTAVDVSHAVHGPSVQQCKQHIIVLHGLLGCKRNWESVCQQIARTTKVCVIAADARNHGQSPRCEPHSYEELSSDVAQLMSKLDIKKAHLIGHSMGGRTAMTLALLEPSKVSSLVIADISPIITFRIRRAESLLPRISKIITNLKLIEEHIVYRSRDSSVRKVYELVKLIDNHEMFSFIISNLGRYTDKTYGWRLNTDILIKDFHHIASFPTELYSKKYTGPVLLVAGGKSGFVQKEDEPKIRKLFPQLELKYIEHVGHNVHAEDPKAFLAIIIPFLKRVMK